MLSGGDAQSALCVRGALLYEFCARHDVPHARCGKFVIARDVEEPPLEALAARGTTNGAEGLEIVDAAFVRSREPHVRAHAAIWSPATGIVEPERSCIGSHSSATTGA